MQKINLIGIDLNKKTTNENGQSMNDFGALWYKFKSENYYGKIPNKIDGKLYAVYYDYESDEKGEFSYFIGAEVSSLDDIPSGLTSLTIPEQKYELFTAKGKIPECIGIEWSKIWSANIKRTFNVDFEVYSDKSSDLNNAEIDIYISVE